MLRLHKLRAFLTMLGVIIGVMSVTVIVMVSNGFQQYMKSEFDRLGADTIHLQFDRTMRWRGQGVGRHRGLSQEDAAYLRERVDKIDIISGLRIIRGRTVSYMGQTLDDPRVQATDHMQMELNRVEMLAGRGLTETDMELKTNVCVIGDEVSIHFFATPEEALGELIQFRGISLEVVGVMKKIEVMGESTGRDIWVPLTTAESKWVGGESLSFISMRPKPEYTTKETMDDVWEALMIRSDNRVLYRLESREEILESLQEVLGGAGMILASIAALSLLVGGIGIMNIMLVSVTERTREIGLRKAVGGTKQGIMTQFLVESAVLSMVGGIIGMSIAYSLGVVVQTMSRQYAFPSEAGLTTPFPLTAAILAALFSACIGAVFGLYPAARAASLSPMEALRTE